MAEYRNVDISSLKDTLYDQQQLIQRLYSELEAEREASATATNETLSLILRLQGEKAAIKMEAEQYKRFAEAKIRHAEESLAIFEDQICQKEMQVAALDYKVQAYRRKLLSMGCVDNDFRENIDFCENIDSGMSHLVEFEMGFDGEDNSFRVDLDSEFVEEERGEMVNCDGSESPSFSSRLSTGNLSIHDVFEVPQVDRNCISCDFTSNEKEKGDLHEIDGYFEPVGDKLCAKDVSDWLKKLSQSNYCENGLCAPIDIVPIECRLAEIVEIERREECSNRVEELKMLVEIKEQIDLLHNEVRSWKVKNVPTRDEPSLSHLSEAMLYFWL